ncbi:hypothetical protein DQ384_13555 [Sphaerisporangium album]|uniref:Uncharacterized protein n=1 Tax=Sphaerisporangium album TaxID=509200 RepID=A0A367FKQ0_9ACTN|nr:hypothetical protein [Sphaerisporangium album]RCG30973.1 hypothetical protein DQ384_13555 [Sphaerisporangium album]
MNVRRLLTGLAALLVLAAGLVTTAAAPAAAAPSGTIGEPSADGVLYTRAPITFRGTLSGAARMVVAVSDRVGNVWWHSDGTWGDYQGQEASLDGGSWSFTWQAPEPGDYLVQAKAVAADGSVDTTLPYRRFTVVDLPAALADPAGVVTEPSAGAIARVGAKTTMRGAGQAAGGVTWAALTIFDAAAGTFWHADGTWGAFEALPVTLDAPGAARVTWTYDWTPPREGDFWVSVRIRNAQGVTVPSPGILLRTDAAPPAVTAAAGQATHPAGQRITWTGTASDNRGVASVRVAIMDRTSRLWWRDDGTWGAYQDRTVPLTGPLNGKPWQASASGQLSFTETGWTYTWTPPATGDYGLSVLSVDATGLVDTAHPWQAFSVVPPGPDGAPPGGTVTSPVGSQGYTSPDIQMRGTATDDVAVAKVVIGVENLDTGKWWQANGTWGNNALWAPATLTGENWSHTWRAPAAGHYVLAARIVDTANKELTRWQSFDHDPGTAGRYVSLLMSRTQWSATDGACRPLRAAVPLRESARLFKASGFTGTGTVVVNRALDQGRQCLDMIGYANWADLATLRDEDGWSFVSHGAGYRDMTSLTPQEQRDESCGSLGALESHGHDRAWGLFVYPNDKLTAQIQQDVVSTCFAFGRKYGTGFNKPPGAPGGVAGPWFQNTWSIPGGRCNDTTKLCAKWVPSPTDGNNYTYAAPDKLGEFLRGYPGTWRSLQAYRFMRGKRIVNQGQGESWDCTGSDWRTHWTGGPEAYCLDDFLAALAMARGQATVTDPATVAEAWGRTRPTAP